MKPDGKGGKSMHAGGSWTGRYYSLTNFIECLKKNQIYTGTILQQTLNVLNKENNPWKW